MSVKLPLMMLMTPPVVGGGGPTVTAIETIVRPFTSAGSDSATITTSLLTTDRVVVIIQKSTTIATQGVSGLGATWTQDVVQSSSLDFSCFSASGVTGTGTVTVTGLNTVPAAVTVLVLRSSSGSAVTFLNGNQTGATLGSGGTVSTSSGTATAGALVIGAAYSTGGTTLTFPHGSSSPSGGWSTVRNSFDATSVDTAAVISRNVTSSTSITLVASPNASAVVSVARAAYIP